MSFCLLCVCLYATLTILICQYLKLLVTFNIATCDFFYFHFSVTRRSHFSQNKTRRKIPFPAGPIRVDMCVLLLWQLCGGLLLIFDLPVNEHGQRRAQQDDRTDQPDLPKLPHDHRAQNFAAQFELQSKRQSFCQRQPRERIAAHVTPNALYTGDRDHRHANIFKKQDCQKRIWFILYIPLPSTGERGISVK